MSNSNVNDINEDYQELWSSSDIYEEQCEKYNKGKSKKDGIYPLWPLQYPDLKLKASLLFIGSNPSFVNKEIRKRLSGNNREKKLPIDKPEEFYKWDSNIEDERMSKICQDEHEQARNEYSYFEQVRKFTEDINIDDDKCDWEHVDMFAVRDTSQKRVLHEILEIPDNSEPDLNKANDFAKGQLEIFNKLLYKFTPKAIIVINATISKIIRNNINCFDALSGDNYEKHLCFSYKDGVPVFFAGMLGGRRAMDVGSRNRLKWHINQVLKEQSLDS